MKKQENRSAGHAPRHFQTTSARKAVLLRRAIGIFFMLVFIGSALGLAVLGGMMYHENQQLEKLAMLAGKAPTSGSQSTHTSIPGEESAPTESTDSSTPTPYETLYDRNNDYWGWLQIEGTRINYPVMHSPDDPEKYLHANFDGGYSYSGLPFLDAGCTQNSDNLLIYGHNMIDGSMFTELTEYKNQSYWESHPVIRLDTAAGEYEYEVMFAFYDRVYSRYENVFKFYQFIDAEDEQDFQYAIASMKSKQLYDTGVDASYGDQLITLVTCEYHTSEGRFVVVARRK